MILYRTNFCECGCGGETGFYVKTSTKRGFVKGAPCRYINGHTNKNKIKSEEWQQKITNANTGKVRSEEAREKNRQAHLGKKHSEESKQKQSASQKKVIHTEEWNKKVAASLTGLKRSEEFCQKCSKRMKGHEPPNKGVPRTEEQNKKQSECMKGRYIGEKSPLWKGGISSESNKIRTSLEYKQWVKSVYKRDGYKCHRCNIGGKLVVHHIINFSKLRDEKSDSLFDITNGITFCKDCHNQFHKKYTKFNNNTQQIFEFIYENH